jgi:hypothetical protein
MALSACLRIDSIWLSAKRDFFMQNLPALSLRKILLLITVVFRGDYLPTIATGLSESQNHHQQPGRLRVSEVWKMASIKEEFERKVP